VSCSDCHGGHPEADNPDQAHRGILSSTKSESPLYFTNIPDTCGKCHTGVLQQFKKSAHYHELKKSGKGPNCLTCHGSMATWVLKPDQMEQTCSVCHRKPVQAQAALMSLRLARSSIEKVEDSNPGAKNDPKFLDLKKELGAAEQMWHSFNMSDVLESSRKLTKRAHELGVDMKLKKGKEN